MAKFKVRPRHRVSEEETAHVETGDATIVSTPEQAAIGPVYEATNLPIDEEGDTTSLAPYERPPDRAGEKYAQSPSGLADKYLISTQMLPSLVGMLVVGALIVYDNYVGKMDTAGGIGFTALKCGAAVCLSFGALLVFKLARRVAS